MTDEPYPQPYPAAGDNAALGRVYRALWEHGSTWDSGQDWTCSAHNDERASLGVFAGKDQPVVFKCQAGCTFDEIVASLDLSMGDVMVNARRKSPAKANPVRTRSTDGAREVPPGKANQPKNSTPAGGVLAGSWIYLDENKVRTVGVKRYDRPDGTKHFAQRSFLPDGSKPYHLYRLPRVLGACARGWDVLLVAGEKSVHAVIDHGEPSRTVTTTMRGGEAVKWRKQYTRSLRGAGRVSIVADRDRAGFAWALGVAAELRAEGITAEIRLSATEGAKDDVVEHLAAGRGLDELVLADETELAGGDRGALPWPTPSDPMAVARRLIELEHTVAAADPSVVDGAASRLSWRGDFYDWVGPNWARVDDDVVVSAVYRRLEHATYSGATGLLPWSPNRARVGEVVAALKAVVLLDPAVPDGSSGVVSFANGLLDLPTRTLGEHSPAFFNTVSLPFPYVRRSPEPLRWRRFLKSIWPDDSESVALLQEVFGYIVSGRTDLQKIPLVIGPTRSGKGTIAHVIAELMGRSNVCAPTLSSLASDRFALQALIGKSVAIVSDARFNGGKDQSVVAERLLSISGEDWLTVDRKNKESWHGQLSARFVIMSNEAPALRDSSGALANRFVMLQMTRSFLGEEDYALKAALTEELPAVLSWALDGYDRLAELGRFTEPRASREVVRDLLRLSSPVTAFVQDMCVFTPDAVTPKVDLWHEWKAWAESSGQYVGSAEHFGRSLLAAEVSRVQSGHLRVDGKPTHVYKGVRIRKDRDVNP